MLQILDLGLSPTMNREMARYSVQPDKTNEARDLVRTLEVGYWLVGIIIGSALVAASPWVAAHRIKAGAIPVRSVRQALTLMGIIAAFQWPVSFYQGGLIGLRKQVLFNLLRIATGTVTNGGAVLVLGGSRIRSRHFFYGWLSRMQSRLYFGLYFCGRTCLPQHILPNSNFIYCEELDVSPCGHEWHYPPLV